MNVGEGDGATEDVRDVAGALQAETPLPVGPVRRLQIATGPGCEPEDGRGSASPEIVVLGDEVESVTGVGNGTGQVTLSQRKAGAMYGDGAWQTPERLLVRLLTVARR